MISFLHLYNYTILSNKYVFTEKELLSLVIEACQMFITSDIAGRLRMTIVRRQALTL